ncbi:CAAX protease family protein [Siminovitchia terrae]|uniref:CAAX protease family protein n=1 Tax=Siminovitchia terrae TaxID=1914933 RepID=A0A429X5M7_SIMTE|nr:CPBP family intramembrane glutamic endopeptidase [Siminovitchia terrae]RST58748.1 CPBP family intramembrane metalloprotease [Siminovitchia terrae]GIN89970.1 CAAX protease family protein [Siminovitchia terrae]GIN94509.1 CAAX protease family protein [Siminovitchia terrae]
MFKKWIDFKLIGGLFFAFLLIYVTFDRKDVFWYLYTATLLFLISYTIVNESLDDEASTKEYIKHGLWSGIALYIFFFAGDWILSILSGSLEKQVASLYKYFSFEFIWHYLVLLFIIVPGEEIFWRGFVLKRMTRLLNPAGAVFITALLNGAGFILSGYPILILAAFVSGLVWGTLYIWKRSIPLVIFSHLTFDLLLLMVLPLY